MHIDDVTRFSPQILHSLHTPPPPYQPMSLRFIFHFSFFPFETQMFEGKKNTTSPFSQSNEGERAILNVTHGTHVIR